MTLCQGGGGLLLLPVNAWPEQSSGRPDKSLIPALGGLAQACGTCSGRTRARGPACLGLGAFLEKEASEFDLKVELASSEGDVQAKRTELRALAAGGMRVAGRGELSPERRRARLAEELPFLAQISSRAREPGTLGGRASCHSEHWLWGLGAIWCCYGNASIWA